VGAALALPTAAGVCAGGMLAPTERGALPAGRAADAVAGVAGAGAVGAAAATGAAAAAGGSSTRKALAFVQSLPSPATAASRLLRCCSGFALLDGPDCGADAARCCGANGVDDEEDTAVPAAFGCFGRLVGRAVLASPGNAPPVAALGAAASLPAPAPLLLAASAAESSASGGISRRGMAGTTIRGSIPRRVRGSLAAACARTASDSCSCAEQEARAW